MKQLLVLLALFATSSCYAQEDQVACMHKFDEQFSSAGTEMTKFAGALNYSALMQRISQCIQGGKCLKMELVIAMNELMVDEEVIRLQREKLASLEKYFKNNMAKFTSNDYCAVMATFPTVMAEMRALNDKQLERFKVLLKDNLEPLLPPER